MIRPKFGRLVVNNLTTLEAAHDGAAASRASFRHPTQLPNSSNEGEKRKQIVSFDKKSTHAQSSTRLGFNRRPIPLLRGMLMACENPNNVRVLMGDDDGGVTTPGSRPDVVDQHSVVIF